MTIATAGEDGDSPTWLTEAETGMWQAFRNGSVYDLRVGDPAVDDPHGGHSWGPERSVRARIVAWLLLSGPPALKGRVSSLRLQGVRITDVLDLAGGTVAPYFEMMQCRFDREVLLEEAHFTRLRLLDCSVPCLEGVRVHTRGALQLPRCRFANGVRLTEAHIGTDLLLNAAVVGRDQHGKSIMADRLLVGHGVQAEMMETHGEVSLRGAAVGESVSLRGSRLTNPYGRYSLNAPLMSVGRALLLTPVEVVQPLRSSSPWTRGIPRRPFESVGGIRLDDGRFGDAIDLDSARFTLRDEQEVSLRRVHTEELRFTGEPPQGGLVVLNGAQVVNLVDRLASWPGPHRVLIDGFVYDNLISIGSPSPELRLEWLTHASSSYAPQPYEQLAAVYHRSGDHHAARQVRRAQRRRMRAALPRQRRVWQALQDTPGAAVALWVTIVIALLMVAWLSTRAALQDIGSGAALGPSDAPPVVVAVVSAITASGVLIGGILNGLAKFVRARGQNASDIVQARGRADADVIRAQAEMRRAEADLLRARVGLPPAQPDSSATPETGLLTPPGLSGSDEGDPSPP
ncbi:oxidoreductase [Streptomyces sp. NPDC002209]|uniref:oxidoreductase n=1 Tax=Streptomyces sp. NPDC002209 TaxID=3364638 RepID=UPI003695032D